MGAMVSQIISLTIVYSTVCSGAGQRKHQSSTSLDFMRGFHRWPVDSPHKGPITRKMFPYQDVIMWSAWVSSYEPLWITQHLDPHCSVRDWTWLAFVQVIAGPLFGTKALPMFKLILTHHRLNMYEHNSVTNETKYIFFKIMNMNVRSTIKLFLWWQIWLSHTINQCQ